MTAEDEFVTVVVAYEVVRAHAEDFAQILEEIGRFDGVRLREKKTVASSVRLRHVVVLRDDASYIR